MNPGACEYFCHTCGQLRLSLKPERPTTCGNCASERIDVDKLGTERLTLLHEKWNAAEKDLERL